MIRFAYPQYYTDRARFMTYTVVAKALTRRGHQVVEDMHDCDAVLYSMCDVTEYPGLVKLRKATARPIIVGGAYAYNYWSAILYADAVWIGEVYDMADCQTLDDLMAHPACYAGDARKRIIASTRIEWGEVPVCQIDPKKAYYWGGVGCKNKCRFCFTSWTHRHAVNTPERIEASKRLAATRKLHLMVCSNEYTEADGGKTMDMLLRDYIKRPVRATMVRCGVEFATEQSRKRMGKPITRDDLYAAIQKMSVDGQALRLFHISGYDALDDWRAYIDDLCAMLDRHPNGRLLHLMFNNLQYQNYTPLYAERRQIDPSRYIDTRQTKAWFDYMRQHTKHVLIGAPSPFQHVAARMGVELATERGQLDYWLSILRDAKNKLTVPQAHEALHRTGVLDCAPRKFDFRTGEITVQEDAKCERPK